MHIHRAHMAAGRQITPRRALAVLLRITLFVPLAAFWAALAISVLAAVLFGWYAAGVLLLGMF